MSPVLVYESITAARRWQGYAARSVFILCLLGALVAMWNNSRVPSQVTIRAMAELGESFSIAVTGTQLALVMLAAPAATAGAICLDRARGTLSHLLVTDLSAAEIVLGKLAARLVPVLCLLACALPMMELLTLVGGVDPEALWGGFIVSVGVAVLGCSLAMLFSLLVRKTHEALLATYAVWALWLLARPMIGVVSSTFGWGWAIPPKIADPFLLVLDPSWNPRSADRFACVYFLAGTCSISAILVRVAIVRLRAVCTREVVKKPPRLVQTLRERNMWRLLSRKVPWLTPSIDRNPVLWREWVRTRPSRWAATIAAIYVAPLAGIQHPGRRITGWPRCGVHQRISSRDRSALAFGHGGDVAGRGTGARWSGPAHEHVAFDTRDRAWQVAGGVPEGPEGFFVSWATLATVVAAWFAIEVLGWALINFDDRLGRVADGSSKLLKNPLKMRVLSGIFVALALFLGMTTSNPEIVPPIAAVLFVLGTLLAAASAASSPWWLRAESGSGPDAIPDVSSSRLIGLKWLGPYG